MALLTPKHVEIQCFGLMFSTANQWEVTKTFFFISTITADILTKFGLHISLTQLY